MKDYNDLIKDNLDLNGAAKVEINYNFQAPENEILINKYDFLGNSYDSESEKIFCILNWLNKHIKHTGNYANEEKQDALTLLEYAYDKDTAINCLALSIILCECLLATRTKARVMYMMPASSEDGDSLKLYCRRNRYQSYS